MIPSTSELIPFIQIFVALIFGMILGIERILAGRTAGPRTYGLVAMGSCLLTIITTLAVAQHQEWQNADPLHVIGSIITGVGFIGAGLIVFKGTKLSGLTTAAGIWVAAAIGITVGFGMYLIAFFTTFMTLFVFTVMWQFEHKLTTFFEIHSHPHNDEDANESE
jgi:putative Mg2+ transporter-C (MgtC) family protein